MVFWRFWFPNPDLDFWNFDPKIHFLGPKTESCPFCLKIGTHGISRKLILLPTLVSWISNPNFLFGQIWAKKVKVVRFNWKLTHMVSDPKIHFWANLGRKNQSCLFFLKIGTHGILTMLILIPTLVFWISDRKSIFGQIWAKKVKIVQFGWK